MTTEVNDTERQVPSLATSCYSPEPFASHISRMINYPWPAGTTQADCNEDANQIMRVIIEVVDLYVAGDEPAAVALVAEKLPTLPVEWSPLAYFRAVAIQMAFPIWEQYTEEQQQRGDRYAARYVRERLTRWLRPRHAHSAGTPEPEKFEYSKLPQAARWAYMDEVTAKHDYRRWLTQMQAYLATHTDEDFDPAQLRTISARWQDYKLPQAFF